MNAPIPQKIYDYLKNSGYDVQPILGDMVIFHEGNEHIIYIQVRENKKTYIPITLSFNTLEPEMSNDVSSQVIRDIPTVGTGDKEINTPDTPLTSETSTVDILTTDNHLEQVTYQVPENKIVEAIETNADTIFDENITELLEKTRRTRTKIRSLMNT